MLNKNFFVCLLFDFISDVFLKLFKGIMICIYDLIVSVNSIMFILFNFFVISYNCCCISLKIEYNI